MRTELYNDQYDHVVIEILKSDLTKLKCRYLNKGGETQVDGIKGEAKMLGEHCNQCN